MDRKRIGKNRKKLIQQILDEARGVILNDPTTDMGDAHVNQLSISSVEALQEAMAEPEFYSDLKIMHHFDAEKVVFGGEYAFQKHFTVYLSDEAYQRVINRNHLPAPAINNVTTPDVVEVPEALYQAKYRHEQARSTLH